MTDTTLTDWLDDFITFIINCETSILGNDEGLTLTWGAGKYSVKSGSLKIIECNEVETRLRIKFSKSL